MNKKLAFITIIIYLALADIIYMLMPLFKDRPIKASLYPSQVHINQPVLFRDSTDGAESVLWEFGNGDQSTKPLGRYTFKEPGKYVVRLTIDQKRHTTFFVDVTKPKTVAMKDTTVTIYADRTGITGQKIHFKAIGPQIEWCEWHFGKDNNIDARTPEAFYTFAKPGTYEVFLLTNLNPVKPKIHTIAIKPQYKVTENIVLKKPNSKPSSGGDKADEKSEELKKRLQAIANGQNFLTNYNYLLKKHLCSNPKVVVVINGKKRTDFYSYCQGLQMNSGATIRQVKPEINPQTLCVTMLNIQQ